MRQYMGQQLRNYLDGWRAMWSARARSPALSTRRLFFVAPCLAASLPLAMPAAMAATAAPGAGRKIAMVVQMNGPDFAVDQTIAAHLTARGYTVRLLDQAQ